MDSNDPVTKALAMARERSGQVPDQDIGTGHSNAMGNLNIGRIPVTPSSDRAAIEEDTGLDTMQAPNDISLIGKLSPEAQAAYAQKVLDQRHLDEAERTKVALEAERFALERKKRISDMLTRAFIVFGVVAVLAFAAIVFVLVVTGWKAQSFQDTSILGAMMTATVELMKFLGGW